MSDVFLIGQAAPRTQPEAPLSVSEPGEWLPLVEASRISGLAIHELKRDSGGQAAGQMGGPLPDSPGRPGCVSSQVNANPMMQTAVLFWSVAIKSKVFNRRWRIRILSFSIFTV
jgi:hypothetical protein